MKVAIAGAGYTGVRLAQLCRQQGLDVFAMTRSPGQQAKLAALGVSCELLDLDAVPAPALPVAELAGRSVVYMVPPPDSGSTDLRMARFLAALSALAAQSGPPDKLVYLSTSAVYGDCHGRSADETTPTRPASDRGRRRLDAEQQVLTWGQTHDVPVCILRVPGIYGPGRLPLARLAAGATVARDNGNPRPGNRIHVDDLCGACLAALTYTGDHQVFNVGDGNHASMGEYFRRVAALAGLPAPDEQDMETLLERSSPMMRGFLQESRRLDTTLMVEELDFQPRYRSLDAGILASLGEPPEFS